MVSSQRHSNKETESSLEEINYYPWTDSYQNQRRREQNDLGLEVQEEEQEVEAVEERVGEVVVEEDLLLVVVRGEVDLGEADLMEVVADEGVEEEHLALDEEEVEDSKRRMVIYQNFGDGRLKSSRYNLRFYCDVYVLVEFPIIIDGVYRINYQPNKIYSPHFAAKIKIIASQSVICDQLQNPN